MNRISYNVELNSRPDQTGRWVVMVRLHSKGHRPGRVLTGLHIPDAHLYWAGLDKKRRAKNLRPEWGRWVLRHVDKDALNSQIMAEVERIKKQVEQWQQSDPARVFSPAELIDKLRGLSSAVVGGYLSKMAMALSEAKAQSYRTWLGKRTALNTLRDYIKLDIAPDAVTPELVRGFQNHLLHRPADALRPSTVNTYLDSLHGLHRAMLVREGISPKKAALLSPWTDRTRPPEIRPDKIRLTELQIEQVSEVSGIKTRRRVVTPQVAFTLWQLSHQLAGMRISDLLQLRYRDFRVVDDHPVHLHYAMMKTGFQINIPLLDDAQSLLSVFWKAGSAPLDYVIPLLKRDSLYGPIHSHSLYKSAPFAVRKKLAETIAHWTYQINLCLKEVEKKANLPGRLSTHTARHSFADLARRIMQEDKSLTLYDIQLMLGHGDHKTTMNYIEELSGSDATAPMTAVFGRKKRAE